MDILKELEITTDVLVFRLLFSKLQEYHVAKDLSDIDFSEYAALYTSSLLFCFIK